MVWFYDDQPGVVVRAYWEAPWRYRHYFPATGIAAAHRPLRKSVGRQSPDEAGENVSPFMVEQLGVRARSAAARSRSMILDGSRRDNQPAPRHRPHAHGAHRTRTCIENIESMSSRMNIMINRPRKLLLLAVIAAGMLPAAAQARRLVDSVLVAQPACAALSLLIRAPITISAIVLRSRETVSMRCRTARPIVLADSPTAYARVILT